MKGRELDRGGLERDAVRVADLRQHLRALDQSRWRIVVVELGAGLGVGQQPTVVDATRDDADATALAGRQQSCERGLIEQGVAAGEQKAIERACIREPGQHFPLVHACTDRPDRAIRPQSVKRAVCPVHGLGFMVVRVVDMQDIDPVEAQPSQTLLERSHHAVIAEIEHRPLRGRTRVIGVLAVWRDWQPQQTAHLGGQHVRVARLAAEHGAQTALGRSVPVHGGRVEEPDTMAPGRLDHLLRIVIGHRAVETPEWSGSQAERRKRGQWHVARLRSMSRVAPSVPQGKPARGHAGRLSPPP